MSNTSKTQISRSEYLQLVGLKTLAAHHVNLVKELIPIVQTITGEDPESYGHGADLLWGDESDTVDRMLRTLSITVVDDAPTPATPELPTEEKPSSEANHEPEV